MKVVKILKYVLLVVGIFVLWMVFTGNKDVADKAASHVEKVTGVAKQGIVERTAYRPEPASGQIPDMLYVMFKGQINGMEETFVRPCGELMLAQPGDTIFYHAGMPSKFIRVGFVREK